VNVRNKLARVLMGAFLVVAGLFTLAAVLGFDVFPTNIDNSRKPELVGCYSIDNYVVSKVTAGKISYSNGSSNYSVASDKNGLGLLPQGSDQTNSVERPLGTCKRTRTTTTGPLHSEWRGQPEFSRIGWARSIGYKAQMLGHLVRVDPPPSTPLLKEMGSIVPRQSRTGAR
jgi:hypothetical protein